MNGCATFSPNDGGVVYILTGKDTSDPTFNIYKYNFDMNTYTLLHTNSSVDSLSKASCAAFSDAFGHLNLVAIGGVVATEPIGSRNKFLVRVYNITTTEWTFLPEYPIASLAATLLVNSNYLYVIGGEGPGLTKIYKMDLDIKGGWVLVQTTTVDLDASKNFVIPYNFT